MITVVNKYKHDCTGAVSVMRPSALGNPFLLKSAGGPYTREESIRLFDESLQERLEAKDPAVCRAMNDLYERALEGDLKLMCVCDPLPCHAHVIKRVLDEVLSQPE